MIGENVLEFENDCFDYLKETGVLPTLSAAIEDLIKIEPLPVDPLLHILHAIGCPLIPQSQMKTLERKVSRAHDELRYLRRMLVELGGQEDLYDSDTDEEQYMGAVSAAAPPDSQFVGTQYVQGDESASPDSLYAAENEVTPKSPSIHFISDEESECNAAINDEKPCSSREAYAINGDL